MKINSQGPQPNLPVSKVGPNNPAVAGQTSEQRAVAANEVGEFSLLGLVSNLKNDIGVREEAVNLARAKLASGAYLSEQGATETAKGILGL